MIERRLLPVAVGAFVGFLVGGAFAAEPEVFIGSVVSVHGGDTLAVVDEAKQEHDVRLQGVDAPERRQPFGAAARERLAELTKGKPVKVVVDKRDKYDRIIARLEVEGHDLGHRLVADGLAWHYTEFSDDAALAEAEREARAAKRGLWADAAPVPPWEWRAKEAERKRPSTTR